MKLQTRKSANFEAPPVKRNNERNEEGIRVPKMTEIKHRNEGAQHEKQGKHEEKDVKGINASES